jgi:hypothetical protein
MKERKKWALVNSCATAEELAQAVLAISDEGNIEGSQTWDADVMASNVHSVISDGVPYNLLTRAYGIRQQAMHIKWVYS